MIEKWKQSPYKKWVLVGTAIFLTVFVIGLPTFGDYFFEMKTRWAGDGFIDFESLRSFCGFTRQLPGESLTEYRLRSGWSALSAQFAMVIISTLTLAAFIGIVKLVFWLTGSKRKEKTDL